MKLKLIIVSLILLINVGFTFTLLLSTFYQSENDNTSKFSTLIDLFSGEIKRADTDFTKIIQLLKQDKDIEEKTIMGFSQIYPYNTDSKFIYTIFDEGLENDTIEDFITKKNWSKYEHWISGNTSFPPHKGISHQIPDYLIYHFTDSVIDPTTTWYFTDQTFHIHSLLVNPEDQNLPKFLSPIYYTHSGKNGVVVYEINFQN